MRLADYLTERGISDADFADSIGVTRQAVHRYKTGLRAPEWPLLVKIREVTDGAVTADDFMPADNVPHETSGVVSA